MHEVPLKKRAKVNFVNSQEAEFTKCKYKHIVKVISINFAFDHLIPACPAGRDEVIKCTSLSVHDLLFKFHLYYPPAGEGSIIFQFAQ